MVTRKTLCGHFLEVAYRTGLTKQLWTKHIHRGYYTVVQRYEFYFRVAKQFLRMSAVSK